MASNFCYGERYERLIAVNDKPFDASEQKKEEEKLNKFLARYRDESESDRAKRLEKEKKQREEGRLFLRDVVNAYDFRLLGEEKIDGADCYVIVGGVKDKLSLAMRKHRYASQTFDDEDTLKSTAPLLENHPLMEGFAVAFALPFHQPSIRSKPRP